MKQKNVNKLMLNKIEVFIAAICLFDYITEGMCYFLVLKLGDLSNKIV